MLKDLYDQFTLERQYLLNVSPATLEAYKWAWKAFALDNQADTSDAREAIQRRIVELRKAGLAPVSVNTHVRSLNAFLRWAHAEGHAAKLLVIPPLKAETKVPPRFTDTHVQRLIGYQPRTTRERTIHTLSLLILDTGLRVDEALSLSRVDSVDLDSLLVTVRGKGGRQRVVPMSLKGRAVLYRYFKRHEPPRGDLVFFSRIGGKIEQRNALRAFKDICERLKLEGTRCSFHTLRHTFATNYLRAGGNVVMLQRILGHVRLEMTMRYVHMQTADLTAVHDRFSPLAQAR